MLLCCIEIYNSDSHFLSLIVHTCLNPNLPGLQGCIHTIIIIIITLLFAEIQWYVWKYRRTYWLFSQQCLHHTKWPKRLIFLLQGRGIIYLQVSQHLSVSLSLWQQNKCMHAYVYIPAHDSVLQWRSTR